MIQRIQSVYLLLAAITGIILLFVPVATTGEFNVYILQSILATVCVILASLGSLITTGLFKSRKLQMILCRTLMLLFALAAGLAYYSVIHINRKLPGLFLPVISIVFLILAFRAIRKDEKLVRSADRLR
jgi:hypothetical protein